MEDVEKNELLLGYEGDAEEEIERRSNNSSQI
jgi:hypothetical protein